MSDSGEGGPFGRQRAVTRPGVQAGPVQARPEGPIRPTRRNDEAGDRSRVVESVDHLAEGPPVAGDHHIAHRRARRVGPQRLDHGVPLRRISAQWSRRTCHRRRQLAHRRPVLRDAFDGYRRCTHLRLHRWMEAVLPRPADGARSDCGPDPSGQGPGLVAHSVGSCHGADHRRRRGPRRGRDHGHRDPLGRPERSVDDPRPTRDRDVGRGDRDVRPEQQTTGCRLCRISDRAPRYRGRPAAGLTGLLDHTEDRAGPGVCGRGLPAARPAFTDQDRGHGPGVLRDPGLGGDQDRDRPRR